MKKIPKYAEYFRYNSPMRKAFIAVFFLFISILYLHNATRDIYSGDIGDLVTSACVWGVAHPPGYPLFVFIGNLLCHLPISLPPVTKVALISVLSSLFGLILFYKYSQNITKNTFISLLATSILAFSHLYWFHAVIPEVFGLNNFIAILIIFLAIMYNRTTKMAYLYGLAVSLGLSLTHHHTILFLFPTVGLIVLPRLLPVVRSAKKVGLLLILFCAGLSVYIYVPIAASFDPVINWDHATNLKNFIHLVLRKDYGSFAPSVVNEVPLAVKFVLLQNYIWTLIHTFSYQVIFLACAGIIYFFRTSRWLGFALLIGFILSGPFFVYYASRPFVTNASIGILERFYNLSFILFMFFVPAGLLQLKQFIEHFLKNKRFAYILLAYFLIIPASLISVNFARTNLSTITIGNRLADDILNSLPQNAVLFVSTDTPIFNVWYAHYVLHKRPDIGLVNPPSVGGNKFLDDAVNEYYQLHPKTDFDTLVMDTVGAMKKNRRIFANHEQLVPNTVALPLGLVYELVDEKDIPGQKEYIERVEKHLKTLQRPRRETLAPELQNLIAGEIPTIYSNAFVRVGNFLDSHYKDPARAESYYRRALWMDPNNTAAYSGLGLVLYKAYNDCDLSLQNFEEAIRIYPLSKNFYLQHGLIASRCNKKHLVTHAYKNAYKSLVKRDLLIDIAKYTKK